MKQCKCGNNISNTGNRTVRCRNCQNKRNKTTRKKAVTKSNKRLGSARRDKDMYKWSKWISTLSSETTRVLIGIYKQKLKHYHYNTKDYVTYKTMLKILTRTYYKTKEQETTDNIEREKQSSKESYDKSHFALTATDTDIINWIKAENNWVQFYDDGVVTSNPSLFFSDKRKTTVNRTLRDVYLPWKRGYNV